MISIKGLDPAMIDTGVWGDFAKSSVRGLHTTGK